mmetsp:Transcript_8666/g.12052  ORF Transcript_8666/g.12052 Transcript_8666/m.12052 type:complete len:80 (+) Transcript_8666:72-311(+)
MGHKNSKKKETPATATTAAGKMSEAKTSKKASKPLHERTKQERELGYVGWIRASKFAEALKTAGEKKKPVFLLFQEIPG